MILAKDTKLVFADVDRTILRSDANGVPTQRVIDAVSRFHDQDGILVPVTTRSAALMETPGQLLGLRHLGVLDGGATRFNFAVQQQVAEHTRWLAPDKIRAVVDAIGALCTSVSYEIKYREHNPANVHTNTIVETAPSVFAVFAKEHETRIASILGTLHVEGHPNAYEDSDTLRCMQIVYAGVSKQSGVEALLRGPYAAIAPRNIAAIGDGETDRKMFAALPSGGLKLAMGNADPLLIEAADRVEPPVPHVNDDGFQVALDNFAQGHYRV
jgi:HAD superfamily hydrolase (TIGR01484 family)